MKRNRVQHRLSSFPRVGVATYGGLGQMAAKIAKAPDAEVTVITRTPQKKDDAVAHGADSALLSTDEDEMKSCAGKFDFVLRIIPQPHDANPFMALLKRDGIYRSWDVSRRSRNNWA